MGELKNGIALHMVLYGTYNEGKYFLQDFNSSYDLVAFNANIISHSPDTVAGFLASLRNKNYLIDPQLYAFQLSPKHIRKKDKSLKNSVSKLSNYYGGIIKEIAGKDKLQIQLLDNQNIKEIAINSLDFQYNVIFNAAQRLAEWEFLEFVGEELRPSFLVSPAFYINQDQISEILDINFKLFAFGLEVSKTRFNNHPLYMQLVIQKEILLQNNLIENILQAVNRVNFDGILLWIENFSELTADERYLESYLYFLNSLSSLNKPIILMRGSFFSIIISGQTNYLCGVGHGIEYGESREIAPIGGGLPTAKFYFPNYYQRVNYNPDAQDILLELEIIRGKENYFKNICNCPMCQKIITDDIQLSFQEYGETKISPKNGRAFPTGKAQNKSRHHYLYAKNSEYEFVKKNNLTAIITKLSGSQKQLENLNPEHDFSHIQRWINVLNKHSSAFH